MFFLQVFLQRNKTLFKIGSGCGGQGSDGVFQGRGQGAKLAVEIDQPAAGAAGASAAMSKFHVPAFVRQAGDFDLSDPGQVGQALTAEGAHVKMSSWGFGGLSESILPNAFSAYTEKLYGVPVTLEWVGSGDINDGITTLPLANKIISDLGYDVIDKEERVVGGAAGFESSPPAAHEVRGGHRIAIGPAAIITDSEGIL